jgi:hypothetical protein
MVDEKMNAKENKNTKTLTSWRCHFFVIQVYIYIYILKKKPKRTKKLHVTLEIARQRRLERRRSQLVQFAISTNND